MAEKVISPGVFTNEIDQSFLPAAIGEIGGVVIGPTVKGPNLIPTVVTSFSEFEQRFGTTFKSGSNYYTYLTSLTAQNYLKHSGKLTVVRILDGSGVAPSEATLLDSGSDGNSLKLYTLGHGEILNNTGSISTNNVLDSGSRDNIRWEVPSVNEKKGTFNLLIRAGNDTQKRKQVLETWNNVTLDPNSNNYIGKMVGDQVFTVRDTNTDSPYLQPSGSYPIKSKYVRVEVVQQTINYLDENGDVRAPAASESLPKVGSGSYHGSFAGGANGYAGTSSGPGGVGGTNSAAYNFYEKISTQSQGLTPGTADQGLTAYKAALNLLSNQDEYDINLIMLPGVVSAEHSAVVTKAIDVAENRGDCFVLIDPVVWGTSNISTVTDVAEGRDTNYAAMYWPWVQVPEPQLGKNVWVPPSVVIPGVYAFNDKVAHPWFAPAGLNRGGITTAVQAERKLTHGNRDDLYESNMNPIATFPGQGVCVWGQKTLQKKASALDRVNVRRLMIKVKKFIASSSRFLVFEQNTAATRKRFLNIANPFLEQVQANSGLTAFKVVMDESNNPPDLVDRNILYGQIFLQPTRTAEFIILDFTVQPTGATFPE